MMFRAHKYFWSLWLLKPCARRVNPRGLRVPAFARRVRKLAELMRAGPARRKNYFVRIVIIAPQYILTTDYYIDYVNRTVCGPPVARRSRIRPSGQNYGHPWLNLYFVQRRPKATKSLSALKLDVTVSYVGHAFQTCHVIT